MDYRQKLEEAKTSYPFDDWRSAFDQGLTQYTDENCGKARAILDRLIGKLGDLGEDGGVDEKLGLFEEAVEALNSLNEDTDFCLIETGEREQLCELINTISKAAGLDPADYGDGEGVASEWRDW